MPRRPGDPFEPGTKVWFRESPEAYTYARSNGLGSGIARESATMGNEHRTQVDAGEGRLVWVPTALLRSSPPRWATGKEKRPTPPKPYVRKEAVDPALGTETTIFDHLRTT